MCDLASTVEQVDDDGIVTLRLCEGLFDVELEAGEMARTRGASVELVEVELGIWPTNI